MNRLECRHAELEEAIKTEMKKPSANDLLIQKLKKEKLSIKDQIKRTN